MASTKKVARAVALPVMAAALFGMAVACGRTGPQDQPPILIKQFVPLGLVVGDQGERPDDQGLYGSPDFDPHSATFIALSDHFQDPEGERLVYSASSSDTEVVGVVLKENALLSDSFLIDLANGMVSAETGPQPDQGSIMLGVISTLRTGQYAEAEGKSATITIVAMDSHNNETTAELQVNLIP